MDASVQAYIDLSRCIEHRPPSPSNTRENSLSDSCLLNVRWRSLNRHFKVIHPSGFVEKIEIPGRRISGTSQHCQFSQTIVLYIQFSEPAWIRQVLVLVFRLSEQLNDVRTS